MLQAFRYRKDVLHAEGVSLSEVARELGTPFYCYSTASIEHQYQQFSQVFTGNRVKICYSIKANSNLSVLGTFARLGAGADVVSGGELKRALTSGMQGGDVVFSGVGKTEDEMVDALEAGIMQFNVESEQELAQLAEIANTRGVTAPVALRINPNVDAGTHDKITTGRAWDKFGIPWPEARDIYRLASNMPGLEMCGIAIHIGSQLTNLEPLEIAFRAVADAVSSLRNDGHNIKRVDFGGGLGIPYHFDPLTLEALDPSPSVGDYAALISKVTDNLDCDIILEPGRFLVGNAGVLISKVTLLKESRGRLFAVIDAAMNDLMRPALYGAFHEIVPVVSSNAEHEYLDIVGPICESGDVLAKGRRMARPNPGSLLAILSVGAYGAVMASNYNGRPIIPEVLVHNEEYSVVRPRSLIDDAMSIETLPPWLESSSKLDII